MIDFHISLRACMIVGMFKVNFLGGNFVEVVRESLSLFVSRKNFHSREKENVVTLRPYLSMQYCEFEF